MSRLWVPVCLMGAASLLMLAIYAPRVPNHPYAYDEADYMWAGKQGAWANYIDRGGLPFIEFVQKGLELRKDPTQRSSFSQYIRSTGDLGMYRHYHGPVYAFWLALQQGLGVTQESVFRGSGLLLHILAAGLLFFVFRRNFPELPLAAGVMGVLLLLYNRTALSGATMITQHVMFTLWTVVVLGAHGQYFRTRQPRWAYIGMALNGVALATVETALLLGGAFGLAWLLDWKRQFVQWKNWRERAGFLLRCLGAVFAGLFVVWPTSLLKLNVLKGYLMLAYIAVYRKTFSPIGTFELWWLKFSVSPFEFTLLVLGTVAAVYLYSRHRTPALLPWLSFIGLFFFIMIKVTVTYTYYYAPLTVSMIVATAYAAGELWQRGAVARWATVAAVLASVVGTTVQFAGALGDISAQRPSHFAVLDFIRQEHLPPGQKLYLPYQLMPTMHYYHPDLSFVGYDSDWSLARLADELSQPGSFERMLCEEETCLALSQQIPERVVDRRLLDPVGPNGSLFYSVRILPSKEKP